MAHRHLAAGDSVKVEVERAAYIRPPAVLAEILGISCENTNMSFSEVKCASKILQDSCVITHSRYFEKERGMKYRPHTHKGSIRAQLFISCKIVQTEWRNRENYLVAPKGRE